MISPMIQLILTFLVVIGVFVALYFLSRRPQPAGGSESLLEGRAALNALQRELLPPEMLDRIFSKADHEYVGQDASPAVQELFLKERRKIALSWVHELREQILSLRRFHLGSARFYARLSVRTEIKLALQFLSLLFLCRVLRGLFFVRGAYGAPRVVGYAVAASARICSISENAMSFLKAAELDSVSENPQRTPMLL
jgi:hypothetical protein